MAINKRRDLIFEVVSLWNSLNETEQLSEDITFKNLYRFLMKKFDITCTKPSTTFYNGVLKSYLDNDGVIKNVKEFYLNPRQEGTLR